MKNIHALIQLSIAPSFWANTGNRTRRLEPGAPRQRSQPERVPIPPRSAPTPACALMPEGDGFSSAQNGDSSR